jgi:hypothetical protein
MNAVRLSDDAQYEAEVDIAGYWTKTVTWSRSLRQQTLGTSPRKRAPLGGAFYRQGGPMMTANSLKTSKITQIELDDGWHTVAGDLKLVFVWLTTDLSTIVFLCSDDHGQSVVGGFTKILSVRAESYTNNQAMDFLKAGIARLLADPPPYEDSSLARKVREMPEAKALIDRAHRLDHRQN